MNIAVDYVRTRRDGDPPGADFMIALAHISGVEWEVPVTDIELGKLQPWLPKDMRRRSYRQASGNNPMEIIDPWPTVASPPAMTTREAV